MYARAVGGICFAGNKAQRSEPFRQNECRPRVRLSFRNGCGVTLLLIDVVAANSVTPVLLRRKVAAIRVGNSKDMLDRSDIA